MPFLENEEVVKKSYGTLIALLNWVDSYDDILARSAIYIYIYIYYNKYIYIYINIYRVGL